MTRRLFPIALAVLAVATLAQPAAAVSKKQDCSYQAAIVSAVQKARLDGVRQKQVVETITSGDRTWPKNYDNAIPIFAAQIYTLRKRDVKSTDLGAEWLNTCMSN